MRPLAVIAIIYFIITLWSVTVTILYLNQENELDQNTILDHGNRLQMLSDRIDSIETDYKKQILSVKTQIFDLNDKLTKTPLTGDRDTRNVAGPTLVDTSKSPIAVLIMACNRVTVNRAIDSVLRYRPNNDMFPIIVSQDCKHDETSNVIESYGKKLTHIMQPDTSPITVPVAERRMEGYYKISRHYKWALTQIFDLYGFRLAIIIEDDLEVAPDFFSYMDAAAPLLLSDSSLLCVSAWNDNGKKDLIDTTRYDLLYRSDFFPGLGWMLTSDLWHELKPKWPPSYWDDWLRLGEQRKGRSCIRPEISRTRTFGRIGVSKGQYYDKHLKYILLGEGRHDFKTSNLTYLLKENYEEKFVNHVRRLPVISSNEIFNMHKSEVTIKYSDEKEFTRLAKQIGLMPDTKNGIPRTSYKGIVSFYKNGHRMHLIPTTLK